MVVEYALHAQEIDNMEETLSKVRNLGNFIQKHGDDPFISRTITKMLEYKIQQYDEEIKRLNKDLERFEGTYHKESSGFFEEFKEGRAGDAMDFIEWASIYQMRNRLFERKAELEGKM